MSSRAGKLLREEMEYMGPLPDESSEDARAKVLAIIRTLDEQGDISVPRSGTT
jgi:flagellar motor switch protein FliG